MIRNIINDKKYIGQSTNVKDRLKRHKTNLENNNHNNKYLQRSWNKYGSDNFEFVIIEICNTSLLDERERYWIEYYNTFGDGGYNLTEGGKNGYKIDKKIVLKRTSKLCGVKHLKPRNCKKIICLTTGEIFNSMTDAINKYNLHFGELIDCCKGLRKYCNKKDEKRLTWMYYDDYLKANDKEIQKRLKLSIKKQYNLHTKPIICLNNKEIFEASDIAAEKYHTNISLIHKCCKSQIPSTGTTETGEKLTWAYLSDYEAMNESEIEYKINYIKNWIYDSKLVKKVICLNTQKIYNSMQDAANDYGIHRDTIAKCCKGNTQFGGRDKETKEKLIWRYYSQISPPVEII